MWGLKLQGEHGGRWYFFNVRNLDLPMRGLRFFKVSLTMSKHFGLALISILRADFYRADSAIKSLLVRWSMIFERSVICEAIFEKFGHKLPQTVSNLTLRFMKNAFQMTGIDFTQRSLDR